MAAAACFPSRGAQGSVARGAPAPLRAWAVGIPSRETLTTAVLLAGLVGFVVLVRWPQLQMIPPFTDETEESLRAFAISSGGGRRW